MRKQALGVVAVRPSLLVHVRPISALRPLVSFISPGRLRPARRHGTGAEPDHVLGKLQDECCNDSGMDQPEEAIPISAFAVLRSLHGSVAKLHQDAAKDSLAVLAEGGQTRFPGSHAEGSAQAQKEQREVDGLIANIEDARDCAIHLLPWLDHGTDDEVARELSPALQLVLSGLLDSTTTIVNARAHFGVTEEREVELPTSLIQQRIRQQSAFGRELLSIMETTLTHPTAPPYGSRRP
ncbi:hypothetical protein [Streptomyces abikoensis]|uniref:hypothetical protein n=1 Tax=Streptomyces abikoensis TaxID=97398 RepID=UPI0036955A41